MSNPAEAVVPEEIVEVKQDGKGNSWTTKTDKYGGRLEYMDPLGNITKYQRDIHSNLTKFTKKKSSKK